MSVESFRQRLQAGRSRLRREQIYKSWAFVVGLIAAFLCLGLSAALFDVGLPKSTDHWLYLAWVLSAWLGAIALLVSGLVSEPAQRLRSFIAFGLWAGNIAVAAGGAMAPLALIILLLPLGVGAMIIRRDSGNVRALIYLSLPPLALIVAVANEYSGQG